MPSVKSGWEYDQKEKQDLHLSGVGPHLQWRGGEGAPCDMPSGHTHIQAQVLCRQLVMCLATERTRPCSCPAARLTPRRAGPCT